MKSLEERFWSKVQKTSNCWNWTASLYRNGYGQFGIGYKKVLEHRISWELHKGSISKDLCVLHKCDNRACVNPEHLFLGTKKDNSQDMKNKNRHLNGEKNTEVKLTEFQVKEICSRYSKGNISQEKLGKEFNVSQGQIWRIIHKLRWKHIK